MKASSSPGEEPSNSPFVPEALAFGVFFLLFATLFMGVASLSIGKQVAVSIQSAVGSPPSKPQVCYAPASQDLTLPGPSGGAPGESSMRFGVINDQGNHYQDEWSRGIRVTTFEFKWYLYEPKDGVYNQDYINSMKIILASLKSDGWAVQMIPGLQYAPAWIFAEHPDMYFVNQYGERYNPDPRTRGGFQVINAPFNPQARQLIARYFARIFADFDQANPKEHFDSIRVGGGPQGELRYPPASWNNHPHSFWAFDAYAQNPEVSSIPEEAAGWRPGIDPNPASTGQGNLLVNPGFEQSQPDLPTLGWTPDDQVGAEFTTPNHYAGQRSLKLSILDNHRLHQFVRVEPGKTYAISGWLRPENPLSLARILVSQYDAGMQPISGASYLQLVSPGDLWIFHAGSLPAGPHTRFLKVELDGATPGVYNFDDLSLKAQGDTSSAGRDIQVPLSFYNWYIEALGDFQGWQIHQLRRYTNAQLDLVYAGKGLLSKELNEALNNDLRGDSWSEQTTALEAGTLYEQLLAGLPETSGLAVYLTGIDQPDPALVHDDSFYPSQWSAARWLAFLARRHNLPIWGENRGKNSRTELEWALQRAADNGFEGLMWGFESELYGGKKDHATMEELAGMIRTASPAAGSSFICRK